MVDDCKVGCTPTCNCWYCKEDWIKDCFLKSLSMYQVVFACEFEFWLYMGMFVNQISFLRFNSLCSDLHANTCVPLKEQNVIVFVHINLDDWQKCMNVPCWDALAINVLY